jgi:hypothetical protein
MLLVKDRSYDVEVQMPVIRDNLGYAGILRYPVPAAVVTLNGDSRFDISIPSLPGFVTISGKVTDSSGRGLYNVEVVVGSQALNGLPNAELTNYTRTDEDGYYGFVVLSGTNYRLTFYPPIPAP